MQTIKIHSNIYNSNTTNTIWNYYLTLENDLMQLSRYIEPKNQDNVYSFELYKLLILTATECESVMKLICKEISGKECGDISDYKCNILTNYPKLVAATVKINRAEKELLPFEGWDNGPLDWWTAYQNCKHSFHHHFSDATYLNAMKALGALYILIFYLSKTKHEYFDSTLASYISSDYVDRKMSAPPIKQLPDFE